MFSEMLSPINNIMQWHTRKNIRLQDYDYSSDGSYFVTICTKNKINYFGDTVCRDAIYRVLLNNNGKITDKYWNRISELTIADFH